MLAPSWQEAAGGSPCNCREGSEEACFSICFHSLAACLKLWSWSQPPSGREVQGIPVTHSLSWSPRHVWESWMPICYQLTANTWEAPLTLQGVNKLPWMQALSQGIAAVSTDFRCVLLISRIMKQTLQCWGRGGGKMRVESWIHRKWNEVRHRGASLKGSRQRAEQALLLRATPSLFELGSCVTYKLEERLLTDHLAQISIFSSCKPNICDWLEERIPLALTKQVLSE